ncbi:MAG TPA: SEL1-like repeat protein [Kofleriaceae bacterium]
MAGQRGGQGNELARCEQTRQRVLRGDAATLAVMVMTGRGGDPDPERAEQLFERAEEQGVDVEAFRNQLGL